MNFIKCRSKGSEWTGRPKKVSIITMKVNFIRQDDDAVPKQHNGKKNDIFFILCLYSAYRTRTGVSIPTSLSTLLTISDIRFFIALIFWMFCHFYLETFFLLFTSVFTLCCYSSSFSSCFFQILSNSYAKLYLAGLTVSFASLV